MKQFDNVVATFDFTKMFCFQSLFCSEKVEWDEDPVMKCKLIEIN